MSGDRLGGWIFRFGSPEANVRIELGSEQGLGSQGLPNVLGQVALLSFPGPTSSEPLGSVLGHEGLRTLAAGSLLWPSLSLAMLSSPACTRHRVHSPFHFTDGKCWLRKTELGPGHTQVGGRAGMSD